VPNFLQVLSLSYMIFVAVYVLCILTGALVGIVDELWPRKLVRKAALLHLLVLPFAIVLFVYAASCWNLYISS
jgi:hypothetical protein